MNQELEMRFVEFKAFYEYDKEYHESIEELIRRYAEELRLRKALDADTNSCIISKLLLMKTSAYLELHKNNIEGFKKGIDAVKVVLNELLNEFLFEESDDLQVTNKSSSNPDKEIGKSQTVVVLGKMMKDIEHNYNVAVYAYGEWVERKPEHYDEVLLKFNEAVKDKPVEPTPPPSPEKKKKKKGKKKKSGRRR